MRSPTHRPRTDSRSLDVHGDHATIVLRRFLRHPPSTVWNALTDPEQIRQWFLTEARGAGRVGGRVDLITGPNRVRGTGRILAWDPPRLYEYEWNVTAEKGAAFGGEETVVRWEMTPHEGGTLLVLTHRNLTKRTADLFGLGLPLFLDRLESLLDGRPLPDFDERVREARKLGLGLS